MVFHHPVAFVGKNAIHQNRNSRRTYYGNQGFILLYALWILTALSIYIAVVIKQSHNIQPPGNSQLTLAISERQALNILQYVLSRTYSSSLDIDPRLSTYRNASQTAHSNPDNLESVKFLKELLSQMGMELDLSKNDKDKDTDIRTDTSKEAPLDSVKQGAIYYPRNKPFTLAVLEDQYSVSVLPIDAKPNLNLIPAAAMERYLIALDLDKNKAKQLSHTISDWIDSDDFSSDYGAEFNHYLRSRIPYKPRNAPIKDWGELFYLKNMSVEVIELLMNNFVLAGNRRAVSAKYSTPEIIAALANVSLDKSRHYFDFHKKKSKAVSLINLIGAADNEAINAVAQWESNEKNILLVQIESKQSRLEGVFNVKEKKLYSWRFN